MIFKFKIFLMFSVVILLFGVLTLPLNLAHADLVQDFLNKNFYKPIQEEEIQVTSLEEAQANLSKIQTEYSQIMNQINDLQQDINIKVEESLPIQQEYCEGKKQFAELLCNDYKNFVFAKLLNLIINSNSLRDFFQLLDCMGYIVSFRSNMLLEQQQRANAFQAKLNELNSKRDQQCDLLLIMQRKKDLADRILAEAKTKFGNTSELVFDQKIDTSSGSNISPFRPDPVFPVIPESDPEQESSEDGWQIGIASAYGGSSDPYTPNPGISCIGELVDDWSCGVAIPMTWPNYRSYLKRNVLISYNGKHVIARVNDCGYMGAGSRSLDLQPGIFKQFGYETCNAWGLREISYKFL